MGLALLFGLSLASVLVRGRVTVLRHRLATVVATCGGLSVECALLEARISSGLRRESLEALWRLRVNPAE